jgi:hypothetical protein
MGVSARSPRWLRASFVFGALGLALAACGSDGNAPPGMTFTNADAGAAGSGSVVPLSAGEQFLREYASAVCEMYEPCCNAGGLGFERGGCSDWFARVTAAYLPDGFDAEAGEACLEALNAARAADANRCSTVGSFDDATLRAQCTSAFKAAARAGSPLGGSCLLAGDCAASGDEDGSIICYGRRCVLEKRGLAGDGPCYAGGDVELEDEMYTCDASDGVFCHRGDNVCTPHVAPGEYCPWPNACGDDALCVGGACTALPARGERCLNGIPGAGGSCRSGDVCDTTTIICGPGLENGAACAAGESGKCASKLCVDGVCAASDFQQNLNCTG